jgi:hypothetical protein
MKTPHKHKSAVPVIAFTLALSIILFTFLSTLARAEPAGATIGASSSSTAIAVVPGNRSDAGGTINTMDLSARQQNANWKAYIGNVSGVLTLDDSAGFSIYQWALSASQITGRLYVSRASTVGWTTVNCSNTSLIISEEVLMGFVSTSIDDINKTFNATVHPPIFVAGKTINQNTCRSTATYVNNTMQDIATADFPEVLMASGTDLIYVTPLNQGNSAYQNGTMVDYQIIVPDDVTTAITRYYFYLELGS